MTRPRLPLDPEPSPIPIADALADLATYAVLGLLLFQGVVAIVAYAAGVL